MKNPKIKVELTPKQVRDALTALRLRVDSAIDNQDEDEANKWQKLVWKFEEALAGGK